MNKHEELNDEIDSYELNDEDFNQHQNNSTLLMDRFGNESPDDIDETFLKNRKSSTGWLLDTQPDRLQSPKPNEMHIIENDDNFITELDVNSTDLTILKNRKLSDKKDDETSQKSKNKSNILNELPTLLDYQEDIQDNLPLHISNNLLSLEQLSNITKKDNQSSFMLDDLNLSLLSKYLIKETNSNQLEIDNVWTLDGLLTEMAECFKNL